MDEKHVLQLTAAQLDEALSNALRISNPNLLDNWYFGNPVNKRGQTDYAGSVYTIDRWIMLGANSSLFVGDGYVRIGKTDASGDNGRLTQRLEAKALRGKRVTFSVLTHPSCDGTFSIHVLWKGQNNQLNCRAVGQNLYSFTVNIPDEEPNTNSSDQRVQISVSEGTVTLVACKLELGSVQTLAHQENGVWVLNEIPNYAEELAKCQRYQYVIDNTTGTYNIVGEVLTSTSANGCRARITTPVAMRATPSATLVGEYSILCVGSVEEVVTGVAWATLDAPNVVRLALNHNANTTFENNGVGWLSNTRNTNSKIILDANL